MRRRLILIFTAVLIACVGGAAWHLGRQPAQGMPSNTPQNQGVPITAGVSATANVPVYLTGLLGIAPCCSTLLVELAHSRCCFARLKS